MNARKITDVTADLVYLVDNAQGICKALYEVGSFDDLVDPDDMDNSKLERFMKAYEVLRKHTPPETCAETQKKGKSGGAQK